MPVEWFSCDSSMSLWTDSGKKNFERHFFNISEIKLISKLYLKKKNSSYGMIKKTYGKIFQKPPCLSEILLKILMTYKYWINTNAIF